METIDTVKQVMAKVAHCSEQDITAELELKDVQADSLHWIQIIVGVENAYDIEIDFEQMRDMTTVGDFVSYIDSCRQ